MTAAKGDVDFFVWIPAFLIIIFVMIIFLLILFMNFGKNTIFDGHEVTVVEYSQSVYLLESSFINLLHYSTTLNGKEEIILNHFTKSLDPLFDISNDEGKNFIEVFGLSGLEKPNHELRELWDREGFDENDWIVYLDARKKIQESDLITTLSKEISFFCLNKKNGFYLELPYGYVTADGLKEKYFYSDVIFDEGFHKPFVFSIIYREQAINILLYLRDSCISGGTDV